MRIVGFIRWARSGGWALLLSTLCLSSAQAQSAGFAPGVQAGRITKSDLTELSGIAASRNNPGVLWVHNDRNRDKLYAVGTNGQLLATFSLGKDVSDMEDIALGPGPIPELDYVYCGDIGDNGSTRGSIRVYRAAEPAVYPYFAANPPVKDFSIVEKVTLTYPDGSHNAEALLCDPLTGDLYVATKQLNVSRLYRLERARFQDGATAMLEFVQQIAFNEVSSGDISPDGREILLRQENFARVWRRAPGQSIADALAGPPFDAPVIGMPIEPNGEGIAFHGRGLGYYTVSEGQGPPIYFFARTNIPSTPTIQELVGPAAKWKYLDDGSDQGTAWRSASFSDAAWRNGSAQFGYGDGDEQTLVSFGSDKDARQVTTYFRHTFRVEDSRAFGALILRSVFDDGIAVYLNGREVLRSNLEMDAGYSAITFGSGSTLENLWQTFVLTQALQVGTNTIAAEVHRRSRSEGDLSFDLQLLGVPAEPVLRFESAPRRVSNRSWALDIQGPVGATVFVEGSTQLNAWSDLGRVILSNGAASFTNSPAPDAAEGYFRLRR